LRTLSVSLFVPSSIFLSLSTFNCRIRRRIFARPPCSLRFTDPIPGRNSQDSDLDLDRFCELIAAELREIVAHPQPAPSTFVFSALNTPFLPSDARSAPEILADVAAAHEKASMGGENYVRKMLMKHYHDAESRVEERGGKKKKLRAMRSVDVFSV
jgi:hypothetical protein